MSKKISYVFLLISCMVGMPGGEGGRADQTGGEAGQGGGGVGRPEGGSGAEEYSFAVLLGCSNIVSQRLRILTVEISNPNSRAD